MGGAQTSLCSCWERQKLPTEFPPQAPPPPAHTNEPAQSEAATAAEGEDDEEVEFELGTHKTFLSYRIKKARNANRSRSVPKSMRPCRDMYPGKVACFWARYGFCWRYGLFKRVNLAAAPVDVEENEGDQLRQLSALPPLDSAFEPLLTLEMVATERIWRRWAIGALACAKVQVVPEVDRCCADFSCRKCCRLDNHNWWLASLNHLRIPGQADPCRALQILPAMPERTTVGWR